MMRAVSIALAATAALASIAVLAKPVRYDIPADVMPALLATPDAEVVVNNCSACHSLDYLTTQPRGKGEQFWRDAVTKMVTVYKAPVSTEDQDAIAKTLGRKLG
jgi:predicted secreted protein